MRLLLEHKADVNAKDNEIWMALQRATWKRYEANVDAEEKYGGTALYWAVGNGTRCWCDSCWEVDAKNDEYGQTAIYWAARDGHDAVVRSLLEHKADIDAEDKDGRTTLHWAAPGGCEAVVRVLEEIVLGMALKKIGIQPKSYIE